MFCFSMQWNSTKRSVAPQWQTTSMIVMTLRPKDTWQLWRWPHKTGWNTSQESEPGQKCNTRVKPSSGIKWCWHRYGEEWTECRGTCTAAAGFSQHTIQVPEAGDDIVGIIGERECISAWSKLSLEIHHKLKADTALHSTWKASQAPFTA